MSRNLCILCSPIDFVSAAPLSNSLFVLIPTCSNIKTLAIKFTLHHAKPTYLLSHAIRKMEPWRKRRYCLSNLRYSFDIKSGPGGYLDMKALLIGSTMTTPSGLVPLDLAVATHERLPKHLSPTLAFPPLLTSPPLTALFLGISTTA